MKNKLRKPAVEIWFQVLIHYYNNLEKIIKTSRQINQVVLRVAQSVFNADLELLNEEEKYIVHRHTKCK